MLSDIFIAGLVSPFFAAGWRRGSRVPAPSGITGSIGETQTGLAAY